MKKSSAINHKLCQGKDVFERMNYLYQASLLVSSSNPALSSFYNSTMAGCAKKSVLRIEHNIKRTICKSCQCPLVPGKSARIRIRKQKILKTICLICRKSKRLPTKKNYKLWWDKPQALLEEYNYSLKSEEKFNENLNESSKKINDNGYNNKQNSQSTSISCDKLPSVMEVSENGND